MFEMRKISIVKRASAWLLDVILLIVLATGFMALIALICNFDRQNQAAKELSETYFAEREDFRKEYAGDIAEHYGFIYKEDEEEGTYTIKTKDGAEKSFEDVLQELWNDTSRDKSPEMTAAYEAFREVLASESKADAKYQLVFQLLFMMVSLGILLSHVVLEFILPIILKNGQTVGKKVFGICLVRPDCVKVPVIALFARAFLGKYAVETMFPVLMVFLFLFGGLGPLAVVLLGALLLLNAVLFFATKNRTPIHDIFANTVAVDYHTQVIFSSEEEMLEKKKAQHKQFIESSKS